MPVPGQNLLKEDENLIHINKDVVDLSYFG